MAGTQQTLEEKLDSISQRMDSLLTEVRQTNSKMVKVEERMDTKIGSMRQSIEEKIEGLIAANTDTM